MKAPLAAFVLALFLCAPGFADTARRMTPVVWASPLVLEGAPNLHRLDDTVYRSAQPTGAGLNRLRAQLGIRTVINLRMFHNDADLAPSSGLNLVRVPVNTWQIEDADVVRVLKILRQRENGPFLIHCMHGADRTGVMSAMYRMVMQGWPREQAIAELQQGGFGFHPVWFNIVRYLEHVDVARIRAQVDSPDPPVGAEPVFPES